MLKIFEKLGAAAAAWMRIAVKFTNLFFHTAYWIIFGPFRDKPVKRAPLFEQMVFMGTKSIVIVFFCLFFHRHCPGHAVGLSA